MKRQDFYYELPEELIAQDPLVDRVTEAMGRILKALEAMGIELRK